MCQILFYAFQMSRNTPLTTTTGLLSKAVCISCIIDSTCAIHESPGRKPDRENVKGLLSFKKLKRAL